MGQSVFAVVLKDPTEIPLSFISYSSDNSLSYFENVVAEV
jgi:hypothetical protein